MHISQPLPGQFELKTRDTVVTIGPALAIGDYVLTGPGEYEVAGVMAEITPRMARFVVEDFRIGYLMPGLKKLADQELEQLGPVDLLFFSAGGDGLRAKELVALVGAIEAPIAIPLLEDAAQVETFTADLPQAELVTSPFKLTRSQLPDEGYKIFVFHSG